LALGAFAPFILNILLVARNFQKKKYHVDIFTPSRFANFFIEPNTIKVKKIKFIAKIRVCT
jgi:hypothetical protein